MMRTIKESLKKNDKKGKEKKGTAAKNFEDVERLVHLLQVHQVELEHQNEELRIAQEELEVSRNKYVNLFDFSPVPYFTLNHEGLIEEVNLRASKMFAVDRKKLIGKLFSSFINQDDKEIYYAFIQTVYNSPVKHSCELRITNKNKSEFHVLIEGLILEDTFNSKQLCQLALIDMTEYKKVKESLENSNNEFKLINNTKDKLFSIIAHDLRSPFQGLLSSSELLASEVKNLSNEEIVEFSKVLHSSVKNLYGLLENLLNWSLMQRNLLEYKPEKFSISDLVNKIIEASKLESAKKKISITNNINPKLNVNADSAMVRSIFQNLISNAIKFSQKEGQIKISAAERGNFVEFSVCDNGLGIKPEISEEIFAFNKIFSTIGTNGEKGTGLGLPLCKEFVERNNGKIWVESELGKGSIFKFTLRKSNA